MQSELIPTGRLHEDEEVVGQNADMCAFRRVRASVA